jgi:dihydrofolate synthase/folylpolyglutamate synthase
LGNTIAEIAAQKAGIIQLENSVFLYHQSDDVMHAVAERAKQMHATVRVFEPAEVQAPDFLPLFQQRNFGLAHAVVANFIQKDGRKLTAEDIRIAAQVHIPGRMETFVYKDKTIILDGAHNGQKITALLDSLRAKDTGKIAFLLGFIEAKDAKNRVEDIVTAVSNLASQLMITEFGNEKDYPRKSVRADHVAHAVAKTGLPLPEVVHDPKKAFDKLLASDADTIVVAGSLYLLNHVRPYVIELTS